MTPAEERKWAQDILKRIEADYSTVMIMAVREFGGMVKEFAENPKCFEKAFCRKIADTFENILWLRDCQKGVITKEEFASRLEAKGKAYAEKRWEDRKKRIERQQHPRRKRKKRPAAKK